MAIEAGQQTLTEFIEAKMREHPVPGAAVGLIAAGEQTLTGFGVTNVDHPLSVDADTLFQIGSITKTFTATAIMRLVEQGKLALDAPIRTYLSDLRLKDEDVASRVTLRHLLTHHAGWFGDFFDDTGTNDDALARYVGRFSELEQLTPLGATWAYSNAGFALAARVMEVITDTTAEDALAALVLRPLGMTRSFFFARDVVTHRVAAGHFVYETGPAVARPWFVPRNAHAIGGIVSSVRDMLRYARFHLGDGTAPDGTRLLSEQGLRAMRAPQVAGALDNSMGLGWWLRQIGDVTLVSHGGGTIGQAALLVLVPEREFGLIVLTNSASGGAVTQAVTGWLLARKLGVKMPLPVPEERSADDLAAYSGTYDSPGARADLALEDGQLIIRVMQKVALAKEFERKPPAPGPERVAACGLDRIVVLGGPFKGAEGEFLRDDSGAIEWLRIAGRMHRRI
jgi:CubicO group peptidase (beta-lactamase class C family)